MSREEICGGDAAVRRKISKIVLEDGIASLEEIGVSVCNDFWGCRVLSNVSKRADDTESI